MDAKKRERLKEQGWALGSVKDFLGLTEEEAVKVEIRAREEHRKSKKKPKKK